ncbi:uncharacterized protein LOC132725416 [Ruditapes philippinarum]|uniref:uncharacterized protein LOC132725416 n=1 Tax=Ruditapes philippinarum TaxID=129788 RepID=UPI00295B91FD|nr:uncharacterized protein LOC132725416 [Ruditapes philippinarum]
MTVHLKTQTRAVRATTLKNQQYNKELKQAGKKTKELLHSYTFERVKMHLLGGIKFIMVSAMLLLSLLTDTSARQFNACRENARTGTCDDVKMRSIGPYKYEIGLCKGIYGGQCLRLPDKKCSCLGKKV